MNNWYLSRTRRNVHAVISSRARGLNFDLRFYLLPYFDYAKSKGSDETRFFSSNMSG